jgi:hypothetical protein
MSIVTEALLFPDEGKNVSPWGTIPGRHTEHVSIPNDELAFTLNKVVEGLGTLLLESLSLTGRRYSREERDAIFNGIKATLEQYKGSSLADQLQLALRLHDNLNLDLKNRAHDDLTDFEALRTLLDTRANKIVPLVLNELENMIMNTIRLSFQKRD